MMFAPGTPPEVMAAAERDWLQGGGAMNVDGQTVLNPRLQAAPAISPPEPTLGSTQPPAAPNWASYGFDQNLQNYLNKQREMSALDAGVAWDYDPNTKTFSGGTLGGPVTKTLAEMQQAAQQPQFSPGAMNVNGQTVLNPRLQQPMDGRPSVPVSQEYLDAITQPQRPIPSQQPSMQQPSMQQPSMQQPQINSMMGGGLGALISQLMGGYGGFNPYMGGYGGFNPYMGGYGGFNPYMGGYGGFNPMMGGYGGFNPMMGGYGGFNPMMGGYGGFSPMMGGIGGFLSQPQFGGGFLNQMMGTQQTGLGGSPNNQTMSQPRSPNLSMFGGASVSPMRNFSGGADLGNRPAPQPLNSPAQPAQQQGTGGGGLF
jgi:hypothetical protein